MLKIALTRSDLSRLFPNNPKAVLAFEQLFQQTAVNTEAVTTGVGATETIADATVITLSTNDSFNNERVLAVDPTYFALTDNGPGNTLVFGMVNPITSTGGFRLQLGLVADSFVEMPTGGRLFSSDDGPYANDAAAAAAGIQIGQLYKAPSGAVAWRQT